METLRVTLPSRKLPQFSCNPTFNIFINFNFSIWVAVPLFSQLGILLYKLELLLVLKKKGMCVCRQYITYF